MNTGHVVLIELTVSHLAIRTCYVCNNCSQLVCGNKAIKIQLHCNTYMADVHVVVMSVSECFYMLIVQRLHLPCVIFYYHVLSLISSSSYS